MFVKVSFNKSFSLSVTTLYYFHLYHRRSTLLQELATYNLQRIHFEFEMTQDYVSRRGLIKDDMNVRKYLKLNDLRMKLVSTFVVIYRFSEISNSQQVLLNDTCDVDKNILLNAIRILASLRKSVSRRVLSLETSLETSTPPFWTLFRPAAISFRKTRVTFRNRDNLRSNPVLISSALSLAKFTSAVDERFNRFPGDHSCFRIFPIKD